MERIGEYLILRLVGEGGMGKVFEAEERLSKRRVALKLLKPELARSEAGRRMFLNEMSILSQLDHPNVVRCLACSEVDDQLVMTLEYLQGKTLRERLNARTAVSWTEAVSILVQVAQALAAAHRQTPPIVHRDLKPENIMLLDDGGVKVMDFGIAKVLEAMHQTTTQSVGTLQYMSPEQIDATSVDARSDLYCLGLVFYEMLSGRPPFDAASPRQLLNAQCTEAPPPLPEGVRGQLPRGVERLLMELLEKSPDERPQTANVVLGQLEPFAPALGSGTALPPANEQSTESGAANPAALDVAKTQLDPASERPDAPCVAPAPLRLQDTVELLKGARGEREVLPVVAWVTVIALSLSAGVVTYLVRGTPAVPALPAVSAPAEQGRAQD